MAKLTKTQRDCLVEAAVYPLIPVQLHDDYPIKARGAEGTIYGRYTLHTLVSNGWLDDSNKSKLSTTESGLAQLKPGCAFVLVSMRCLKASLRHVK